MIYLGRKKKKREREAVLDAFRGGNELAQMRLVPPSFVHNSCVTAQHRETGANSWFQN